jgi:uncharacterized membrane protein
MISPADEHLITEAIRVAEQNTSGEIRVHIESRCKKEPIERAIEVFSQLNMYQTEQRNGVLIYVALKDKKVAIWGDEGINQKLPKQFWEKEIEIMISHFKNAQFGQGIAEAVKLIGMELRQHFPFQRNDKNELSDEISKGE